MVNDAKALARGIWRDGALRSLPLWLGVTLLSANVMALVVAARAARSGFPEIPDYQPILVAWLPVSLFLLLGKGRARSLRLDLALPITARRLWLGHTLALLIATALLLAGALGVLAMISRLLARLYSRSAPILEVLPLAVPLGAASMVAVIALQSAQRGAWKPAGGPRTWGPLLAILGLLGTALVTFAASPLATSSALLVIAGAVAGRTWSTLPAALELAPMIEEPRRRTHAVTTVETPARDASRALGISTVPRLLFHILHTAPPWRQLMPWVLYFFLALTAFFLAGGFGAWTELDESRVLNLPLGAYMLFTGAGLLTYHLHRLDPLPVSRRTLFRLLVLPSLLVFCLGWAAGRSTLAAAAERRQLVEYRIAGENHWVEVEAGAMGFAWRTEPPLLTAPWGESHPAWRRPLFRGSRLQLYSPYAAAEPTSARFQALMASRAVADAYGEELPASEILDRFLLVEDGRVVGLKGSGLVLPPAWRPLVPTPAHSDTPVFLTLSLVPWLLMLAVFVGSFRATTTVRSIRWIYWAGLGLLLALLVGQVVAAITRLYSPAAAYGMLAILCRQVDSRPEISALVWFAGAALVYLSYRLAESRFRRAELPSSPLQCALVDWSKGD